MLLPRTWKGAPPYNGRGFSHSLPLHSVCMTDRETRTGKKNGFVYYMPSFHTFQKTALSLQTHILPALEPSLGISVHFYLDYYIHVLSLHAGLQRCATGVRGPYDVLVLLSVIHVVTPSFPIFFGEAFFFEVGFLLRCHQCAMDFVVVEHCTSS
jgi:hypothetical protein